MGLACEGRRGMGRRSVAMLPLFWLSLFREEFFYIDFIDFIDLPASDFFFSCLVSVITRGTL